MQMKNIISKFILSAALSLPVHADSPAELSGRALIDTLRSGGYNIYFRHAQTDWSQSDHVAAPGDWTTCDAARMRQLSAKGRQASKKIGAAIRALEIPVGRVLASPYCRTVQTAELMNLGRVEVTEKIINLRVADFFGGRGEVVRRARSRLAELPPAGTNVVLVGHGNVAREATPVYPGEAEGVVFRPAGDGSFEVVARIDVDRWLALSGIVAP
jgi:broad specificity phosphatase PhoE